MSAPARPANPERWFRTCPDSSVLTRPRLLARSLIDVTDLDEQIHHYERLLGIPADLRMPIPDFGGLELAAVGNLLLIASARGFTPIQRQTSYSLIVPSLESQLALLRDTGTSVLEPAESILPGARARVRYPEGTLAELVEHRPWQGERPRTAAPGTAPADLPATGVRLLARHAVNDTEFLATVRLYEALLQVPAITHPRLSGPVAARTAVVGNLLLVGLPTPTAHDVPQPGVALIVSEAAATAVRPSSWANAPAYGSRDARGGTVALAGDLTAEIWNERFDGLHRTSRAPMGAGRD
ncbi:VOC family protein [Streptomyces chartreusis]|uniref:VOC family protein n=1 Tax=Streptomyces chartreusis TaxID=1969 RepID=UPI00382CDEA5